jgi:hypothetical protein
MSTALAFKKEARILSVSGNRYFFWVARCLDKYCLSNQRNNQALRLEGGIDD